MLNLSTSKFQAVPFKVKTSIENIKAARNWLKYVNSDKFQEYRTKKVRGKEFLDLLLRRCKEIIDSEIYIPQPSDQIYERTYALIRSFVYDISNDNYAFIFGEDLDSTAGNSNRWNPTGSPLAVAGEVKGIAAYMYFFEKSDASFIPPHRKPQRIFFEALYSIMSGYIKPYVHTKTNEALTDRFSFMKIGVQNDV